MSQVKFVGIGRRGNVDLAAVEALGQQLFPLDEVLADEDLVQWYARLADRIALVEAVLDKARQQRAMVVAHLHDSLGKTFAEISVATKGDLSPQRAGQLAAKGRPHIKTLNPNDYSAEPQDALWP